MSASTTHHSSVMPPSAPPQRVVRAAPGGTDRGLWKSPSRCVKNFKQPRLDSFLDRESEGLSAPVSSECRSAATAWPVLVRLEAGVECLEIGLQVALVVRHRYPIPAGRCLPPQPPERPFERLAREVVEQRREPGLARPDGRVVHPNETGVPGAPALCLDRLRPARAPLCWSLPSVRLVSFAVINGTTPQSATLPTWSQSSGLPRCCPSPVTKPERSAWLPRFRWCLCVHDQVFDPGGSASVSPLRRKRCCLRHLKQPRQPR